jgi:hypothetical protein
VDGCTISITAVHYHLRQLEKQKLIKTIPGEARSIQVIGGRWAFAEASEDEPDEPEDDKDNFTLSFTRTNGMVMVGSQLLRQWGTGVTAILALINLADNLDLEFHRLQSSGKLTGTQQYHLDYMKDVMKMGKDECTTMPNNRYNK